MAPESSPMDAVGTREEAVSIAGAERSVPVRVVQMTNDCMPGAPAHCLNGVQDGGETGVDCGGACPPCLPFTHCNSFHHVRPPMATCTPCSNGTNDCGPDTLDYTQLREAVEKTNWALKSVGVQIHISSIEKYKMPLFVEIRHRDEPYFIPWNSPGNAESSALREQLKLVYPADLQDSDFVANELYKEKHWLHAAAIRAGDDREVVMFVAECANGGDGQRPRLGASSFTSDREIIESDRAFAHEFGHIFGLEHTMDPWLAKTPDEISDEAQTPSYEYWDLMYGIPSGGGANVYFPTRNDAYLWGSAGYPLREKHLWDPARNCSADSATCRLTCDMAGQTEELRPDGTLTEGIKGLAFTFRGDNPAGGVYRRGFNAMMYISNLANPPDNDALFYACPWTTFNESQAAQVRRTFRSDIRVQNPDAGAEKWRGYVAARHLLGDSRAVYRFDNLDFDGDGYRDLAVWQPPGTPGAPTPGLGRFRVLRSGNPTYPYTPYVNTIEVDFGRVGDIPVPADYDGDGIADMAVIRTGGYQTTDPYDKRMFWLYCKSNPTPLTPNCNPPGFEWWGERGDVPLPGLEFDGNDATKEVAVYHRGTGSSDYVQWKVISSWSNGSIEVLGAQDNVVHLHGLYDADNRSDIVLYQPATARFFMLLSGINNWNPTQALSRDFPAALIPDPYGATTGGSSAPALRYGGVPVPAERAGRRILRVWDAHLATWYTMYDPVNSTTLRSKQQGARGDIPITGPIDFNADGWTDMVVFRPSQNPPVVNIVQSTTLSSAATVTFQVTGATSRSVVFGVRDMRNSADNRGELLVVDPDQLSWKLYYSQPSGTFSLTYTRSHGDLGAMIF